MQQNATQTSERVEQVIYAHLLAHNGLLAINKLFDSFHAVIICWIFELWVLFLSASKIYKCLICILISSWWPTWYDSCKR